MSVLGDSGYPAGAKHDPSAPFNQLYAEFCDDCGAELDYDTMECSEEEYCHPIYRAKFWVFELKEYLSWKESQAFYAGDY